MYTNYGIDKEIESWARKNKLTKDQIRQLYFIRFLNRCAQESHLFSSFRKEEREINITDEVRKKLHNMAESFEDEIILWRKSL